MEPISRRNILSALVLAAAGGSSGTENIGHETSIGLAAPKSGTIAEILVTEGENIKTGHSVCRLKPDDEHYALARFKTFESMLAIEEQLFSDQQLALRREILFINLNVARAYLEFAKFKLRDDQSSIESGTLNLHAHVEQDKAAIAKAEGEVRKAEIYIDSFNFSVSQGKQRLELLRSFLPNELQLIESKIDTLDVQRALAAVEKRLKTNRN
jgi:multidrug resistance efflux pump